jgi:hypothetical protein
MAAATSDSKKLSFAESCLELPALSIEIRVLCSRDIYHLLQIVPTGIGMPYVS